MSKLQQSTFFHAVVDSSEQTVRLINAGLDPIQLVHDRT